ncbi:MAG: 50S ribosomal protein L18 [Deltaproteobacteria bacterium]|nr:50S ribosomal protein L18 [Deltaproteobacteria bacterium]MBW2048078.1 50S ribosomal protein L18 [Deltaproteobacteria bacterium]MBW2110462.1 50S ribosomal protein L18 [Deltaproteobacteria bacterium]MBW2352625.1 50S ribosomal protein L18 [Deltaproteobacteria bacterium]
MGAVSRTERRLRRKKRVRKKVKGSPEQPRLSVFRSSKHIYAQIIDDSAGRTLAEASSLSKDLRDKIGKDGGNKKGAAVVGEAIGRLALSRGIRKVAFDRNGFLYHGRVKALSEAARKSGLLF